MNLRNTSTAILASASLALTATGAETHTWTGATDGCWNTTSSNWTVGGSPASWADNAAAPNAAVFNLSASAAITVDGPRVVRGAIFGIRTHYRDPYGRRLEDMKGIRHLEIVSNRIEHTQTTFDLRNTLDVKMLGNVGE